MSPRITLAIAQRVLLQIRHDRRTIALILVVPTLLLVLITYVFEGDETLFTSIGPPLCGLFPIVIVGATVAALALGAAMLRRRTA
jgi:ABC-2 type transport system permease protein